MDITDSVCRLCDEHSELQESHVVPSFVYKWIKDTSATGYLRSSDNNKRLQDGHKAKLLCRACEQLFSNHEREFASNIFHPFVDRVIDKTGRMTSNTGFRYEEWLIKFAISVQWRVLVWRKSRDPNFGGAWLDLLLETEKVWREFLLGLRLDAGGWESHLIFLYNVESATNHPPIGFPENVNSYLLRSVDTDYGASSQTIAQFSKIGPMLIWTYLKPDSNESMKSSLIGQRGEIFSMQDLTDGELLRFMLMKRPRELAPHTAVNDTVIERVKKSFQQNPSRAANSMSYEVHKSDTRLSDKKKK